MIKLAPKLTFGPAAADWQERLNMDRMRNYRAERAKKIMRKYGIPALLEAVPANIRYLTGLRGYDYPMCRFVLFFAEGDPVMYEHDGWYHQMPDQAPWIKEWRPARTWLTGAPGMEACRDEAKQFAADIRGDLKARGLLDEKLGLGGFDGIAREALTAAGIKNIVDSRPTLLEARCIKNQDEINCLKMAAAIVDGVWYRIWETLRPGIKDTDLATTAAAAGYEYGAELAVAGGWRTGPTTFERGFHQSSRILQVGDLVYGSLCGLTYMGYRTCTYRTFIVGRQPNNKEKDWYKKVLDRVSAIIEEIKPGKTTADAAKHFLPASTWGYKEEVEVLASEIGHGIGMGGPGGNYDIPIINRQWSLKYPQVFEEGMAIAVECREGEHRVGGVRMENMVVVTKDGAQIMDHFPREEILVAPR
ncbi:MAG: M24 family metallopeptidase [Deltaproteobacteria bacterium]|nr:M24 family metallopeptidase [Deltaproteobacteria bacterium]MCZ6907763.1 M24 family metallopeptidase [Deltaproteobacteria bacterium]